MSISNMIMAAAQGSPPDFTYIGSTAIYSQVSSISLPVTAQANDLAIFYGFVSTDTSTASGWNVIKDGFRSENRPIAYKMCSGGETSLTFDSGVVIYNGSMSIFRPSGGKLFAFSDTVNSTTTNGVSAALSLSISSYPTLIFCGVGGPGTPFIPISYPTGNNLLYWSDGQFMSMYSKHTTGTNSGNLQVGGTYYYNEVSQRMSKFILV